MINSARITGYLHAKKKKSPSTSLHSTIKIDHQPKCRGKTIKFLEEIIGIKFQDLELGNGFLDIATKAQVTKK